MGMSPYMSNLELWEIKTGRREPKDLSGLPYIELGNKAEDGMRQLFALDFPEYEVNFTPFKILRSPEYQFISATPDGELIELITDRRGGLELKTTEIRKNVDWRKWDNKIPDHYYIQCLHQLVACDWEFVALKERIKHYTGDSSLPKITEKHYLIEANEVKEDISYLISEEIKFWEHVKSDTPPNQKLPQI